MAVTRGVKASGGTDFVTGYTIDPTEMNTDLNNIVSGINNVTIADAHVTAGAAIAETKIDDTSADTTAYKLTTTLVTRPAAATPTLMDTFDESRPTDLAGEIQRLRRAIDEIAGMVVNTSGNVVASEWYAVQGKGFLGVPTGCLFPFMGSVAPTGWIVYSDSTISSAAGAGAIRAANDCHELFRMLYLKFSDTLCPVSGGRTAPGDATTVDTDWLANKTIRLPLLTGRVLGIAGTPISANRVDAITGTATAGGASTITMANNGTCPTKDSVLVNYTIETTGGTGSGQTRTINAQVASTRVLTVSVAWGTQPDATTTYSIYKTVPTRTHGAALGTDLVIPTLDTLAAHTHAILVDTTSTAGAFTVAQFNAASLAKSNSDATGTGSTYTQYAPTAFLNYIVKL